MHTSTHILRGLPGRWVLPVFLLIAAQSAQAEEGQLETLLLKNNQDCREAISNAKGKTLNVQLDGRTLYRDGDWNTLCLPFDMTDDQIAASPLAHASIQKLDASNLDSDGKLTLTFTGATTVTAGKPFIVRWPVALTINNDSDWDKFVSNVAYGTSYEWQIVKLAADINIGTGDMVGTDEQPFKGTFDGGGHTITCDINNNGANYTAPFAYIQDATIMNVKVAGSVKGGDHSAGLVGSANGTNTIKNCQVAATVSSSKTHCGGVLGMSLSTASTTISNCLFSGDISGTATTQAGILCGWTESGGTATISNCLADGTYSGTGTVDMILGNGTKTVTACYKTQKVGSTGTYTTQSATDLAAALGISNWTTSTSGDKAVPLMTATNHVENPTFSDMVIDDTEHNCDNGDEGDLRVRFIGTYNYTSFNADDKSILLMGAGNTLYYPQSGASIGPCRAYFKIGSDGATPARQLTALNLIFDDGDTSGITEAEANSSFFTLHSSFNDWYTLDGRRLEDKPSRAGVYIYKGVKRVVK